MRVSDAEWRQAINDAGRFLDQWGKKVFGSGWYAATGEPDTDRSGIVSNLRRQDRLQLTTTRQAQPQGHEIHLGPWLSTGSAGARLRVIATAGAADLEYVRGLGADEVVDFRAELLF